MEVAKRIVEFERADMLASLVATDNIRLDELPQRLKPLLEAVRASGIRELQPGDLITYAYPDANGEKHVDFIGLLAALSSRYRCRAPALHGVLDLVVGCHGRAPHRRTLKVPTLQGIGLYGIGIILPRSAEEYDRYRGLPFYAQTRFWDYVPYRIAAA